MIDLPRRLVGITIGLCILALLGILVPFGVYWFKIAGFGFGLTDRLEEWAHLGEYLGGITGPFVSLCALVALAFNLILQRDQLTEARAEAQRQRTAVARQSFEGTFFQLLKQFVDVARRVSETSTTSDSYFGVMMENLRNTYKMRIVYPGVSYEIDVRLTPQMYGKVYQQYQAQLGPYFRNLFHLFRFIDVSDRTDDEKIGYANFVRAQLSIEEALLLFYNGTWGEGLKFRDLIQDYGILKHVPSEFLLNPDHLNERKWYNVSAFQNAADRKRRSLVPSPSNARFRDEDFDPDLEFESV
jgi:hypothetical protein